MPPSNLRLEHSTSRGLHTVVPLPSASTSPSNLRLEHSTSRGLHTFVPLPSASTSPSMVTHAGIPSQLIMNPENFRPISVFSVPRPDSATTPVPMTTTRSPSPRTVPVAEPNPGTLPTTDHPRAPTRTTIPVPVRSKQRTSSVEEPQPRKRQKGASVPVYRVPVSKRHGHPGHLPVISDAPPGDCDTDESDDDVASRTASTHDRPAHDPTGDIRTGPVSAPTTLPGSSTITLTPNPEAPPPATLHLLQPNPDDAPREPYFREWTDADDRELASMKQDTRSRPLWKTIGARLHRDPQVCKLRWNILKQTDQYGRVHPPQEPEAED